MVAKSKTVSDLIPPDPALLAYWQSSEFKAYLATKESWEDAHHNYCDCLLFQKEQARADLESAIVTMRTALAAARCTESHRKAFGY